MACEMKLKTYTSTVLVQRVCGTELIFRYSSAPQRNPLTAGVTDRQTDGQTDRQT